MSTNGFEKSKGRKAFPYIVLLVVCAAVLGVWAFGRLGGTLGPTVRFTHAEAYTAGGTTLTALPRSLDIEWLDGRVRIARHAEQTVEIRETSRKTIPGDLELRWWMDGETLRIRYARSGANTFMQNLDKELTVILPEGLALQDVHISTASGDVDIPAMTADSLRLESVSGDVQVTAAGGQMTAESTSGDILAAVAGASRIEIRSTSGDIGLTQTGRAERILLHSTSGGIGAQLESAADAAAESTSGDIAVRADAVENLSISSTSGGVAAQPGAFRSLKIGTTSGGVTAVLPTDPGFSGTISTTSGSVASDLPLTKNGSVFSCGDGSGTIDISTTSGNVRIR